jgi:hypothetical protein
LIKDIGNYLFEITGKEERYVGGGGGGRNSCGGAGSSRIVAAAAVIPLAILASVIAGNKS